MATNKPGTAVDSDAVISKATETVRDIFTYPPAGAPDGVSDVSPTVARNAPAGGAGISKIAEDTIRQALGWRHRKGDVKGFSAALERSFTLKEDNDGRVSYDWTPQSVGIKADMGEITGAQASILEQARVSVNYILPLIEGFKPLRVDGDAGDREAVTAIVRMKINAFLEELGRVGGPRVQRVDLVFEELLGLPVVKYRSDATGLHPILNEPPGRWDDVLIVNADDWLRQLDTLDSAGGRKKSYSLLRQLCEEYGLEPNMANTVDEERDYTNALIVVDSVIALRAAWLGKRRYFDRSDGKRQLFLGTQLVWISRQLEVVAESVREAYAAMDSVYFGPAERDATDIRFEVTPDSEWQRRNAPNGKKPFLRVAPLSVGELMEWVASFAAEEAPRLLQEGGKDGVLAFRSTLARLIEWMEAAKQYAKNRRGDAPRSFFTSRVERALEGIEMQLKITADRAQNIKRTVRTPVTRSMPIADLPPPPNAKVTAVGYPPKPFDPNRPIKEAGSVTKTGSTKASSA